MTDTPVKQAFDAYVKTHEYEVLESLIPENVAFAIFVAGWQAAPTVPIQPHAKKKS